MGNRSSRHGNGNGNNTNSSSGNETGAASSVQVVDPSRRRRAEVVAGSSFHCWSPRDLALALLVDTEGEREGEGKGKVAHGARQKLAKADGAAGAADDCADVVDVVEFLLDLGLDGESLLVLDGAQLQALLRRWCRGGSSSTVTRTRRRRRSSRSSGEEGVSSDAGGGGDTLDGADGGDLVVVLGVGELVRSWERLKARADRVQQEQAQRYERLTNADSVLGARQDDIADCRLFCSSLRKKPEDGDAEGSGGPAEPSGARLAQACSRTDALAIDMLSGSDTSEGDCQSPTAEEVESVLRYFHVATRNRSTGGARTMARSWQDQPSTRRRYYGAPMHALRRDGGNTGSSAVDTRAASLAEGFCDGVLWSALAVSGRKACYDVLGTPRGSFSKRCEASSGGLHPVELYSVFARGFGATGTRVEGQNDASPFVTEGGDAMLCHYAADVHALEELTRIASGRTSGRGIPGLGRPGAERKDEIALLLFSVVWRREIWKYGERGVRYTLLDLGHAFASVSVAARAHGFRVTAMPQLHLPMCNSIIFGSPSGGESGEQCLLAAALTREFDGGDEPCLEIDLEALCAIFSRNSGSEAPEFKTEAAMDAIPNSTLGYTCQWPLADAVADAMGSAHGGVKVDDTGNGMSSIFVPPRYQPEEQVALSRSRRSATEFNADTPVTMDTVIALLKSLPLLPNNGCAPFPSDMNFADDPHFHVALFAVNVDGAFEAGGLEGGAIYIRSQSEARVLGVNCEELTGKLGKSFPLLVPARGVDQVFTTLDEFQGAVVDAHCKQDFLNRASFVLHFFYSTGVVDTSHGGVDASSQAPVQAAGDHGERLVCGTCLLPSPPAAARGFEGTAADGMEGNLLRRYRDMHLVAGGVGQCLYLSAAAHDLVASGLGCFVDAEVLALLPGSETPRSWPLYSFAVGRHSPVTRKFQPFEYASDMLELKYAES